MKKLVCFDFDGTLCDTKDEIEGKSIWEAKNGRKWPYLGWWGKVESIDWETFKTKRIDWTYQEYLKEIDSSDYIILATGRLESATGMRTEVEKILMNNNLSFSEIIINGKISNGVFLNTGGDTFRFKTSLFENLIELLEIDEFTMYDDRKEHLIKFKEWANNQKININIVDAVNKTKIKIKNIR